MSIAKLGRDGDKEQFWGRRLLRAVVDWADAPSSNRDGLLVALAGSLLFGAGGTLLLEAFTRIDLGIELPVWVSAVLALLGLGLGSLLTLCATKKLNRDKTPKKTPALDPVQALGAYLENVRQILSHQHFDIERILSAAAKIVREGTGTRVHISLWQSAAGAGDGSWEPTHRPTLTSIEVNDFKVPIAGSWIAHKQTVHPRAVVFSLDDIATIVEPGQPAEPDLRAFLRHKNRAVVCCRLSTEVDGEQPSRRTGPCLVMLSDTPRAFTPLEERYLQMLAFVLGLRLREQRLSDQLEGGNAAAE